MESEKFWSRVGQWFRKSGPDAHSTSFDAPSSAGADLSPRPTPVAVADATRATGLFRRSRVKPEIERLEAQYARVEGFMDAIERHMESEAGRSERMVGSLDTLVRNLATVPDAFRQQSDALSKIRETISSGQVQAERVEKSLAEWPRLADAQRETMVTISRQLDEARETNAKTTSAVEQCKNAFTTVEQTANASTKAIERYAGDSAASTERMVLMLEQQARRFQVFAWSAMGLAGVAAIIAVVALVR